MKIKLFLQQLLLAIACIFSISVLATPSLQTVKDMRQLKQQSAVSDLPVLLLFTAEDCIYCEAIRKNYLIPMSQSEKYQNKVLIRQLYVDEYKLVRDEEGELVGGDRISRRYAVEITPTILFINAQGQEVARRIIGLSGADYFDKTLDASIQTASKNKPLPSAAGK